MMIQESMRLKVLILPISLAIAVVMAIFFIKPAFSDMMTFKAALADKQTQLENLNSQTQKLQVMKTKWEAMADEKTLIGTAFPETEDVDAYVSEITSKASRSGVLLTSITIGQANNTGASQEYICSNVLTGGADQAVAPATPQASAAGGSTAADTAGLQNLPSSASACVNPVSISLAAKGSWEQMLDFFKYLEDMNRISNIESVSLSAGSQSQSQDQASSDILSADISANAFFKEKVQSGSMTLASNLASQGVFNQKSLDKLKETIYAPYDAPTMSPSGERNIFK